MSPRHRIEQLEKAILEWLDPSNSSLRSAMERTLDEQLFRRAELEYQLTALRDVLTENTLVSWHDEIRTKFNGNPFVAERVSGRTVLAFHAGNLPLAGFQDLVVIAMSGLAYIGKVSKQDPYLLPSLAEDLSRKGLLNTIQISRDLPERMAGVTDILFSGGESSWMEIQSILRERGVDPTTVRTLNRTARYSAAIVDKEAPTTMRELAESMLLYGGKGCRSVAWILSPLSLNDVKCELGDYIETFWLKQGERPAVNERLRSRAALNRAIGRPFTWLDSILIEQSEELPNEQGVIVWRQTPLEQMGELIQQAGKALQSIYTPYPGFEVMGVPESQRELLSRAQRPSINWRPDGTDPLAWLAEGS